MYRTRPAFFSSFRAASHVGSPATGTMTRSILGALVLASHVSMCAFTVAAPGCGGAPGAPGAVPPPAQERLFCNPNAGGTRGGEWPAAPVPGIAATSPPAVVGDGS